MSYLKRLSYRLLSSRLLAVKDVGNKINIPSSNMDLAKRRGRCEIVVIDDKPFAPSENLKRIGYKLSDVYDLHSIGQVKPFEIILCDLYGVGRNFSEDGQGAFLIKEIKAHYPEKYVIAYTGGGMTDVYTKGVQYADTHLKKDANTDEWCSLLDNAIDEVTNPIKIWRKARVRMLNEGISPLDLALTEDLYVRLLRDSPSELDKEFRNQQRLLPLSADARAIIQNLTASAIWEFIKGSSN